MTLVSFLIIRVYFARSQQWSLIYREKTAETLIHGKRHGYCFLYSVGNTFSFRLIKALKYSRNICKFTSVSKVSEKTSPGYFFSFEVNKKSPIGLHITLNPTGKRYTTTTHIAKTETGKFKSAVLI